jgi:hypothetical protein
LVLVFTLCLVLLAAALTAPAFALGPRAIRLMLGGAWMGQSYNYKDIDLYDSERKFWMTGGASLEIGLLGDSPLDLEVGAMFFQKGAQLTPKTDAGGTVKLDPGARYLSIPVMLRYTLSRGTVSPYIVAGPTLEIMLSSDGAKVFDEVYDQMDTANLGIQVGVGAELGNIGASLRYMRDLNTPYNKLENAAFESVVNDGVLALVTLKLWGH